MKTLLISFFVSSSLVFGSFAQGLTINLEKSPKKVPAAKRVVPKTPVILDTRSSFDYSMSHFAQSLPIRWDDFNQTEEPHRSALDPDASLLSRRLRIFGIEPNRE